MKIGQLDQRITIQVASRARDGIGNETLTWQTWRTVWANVQTTGGTETFYSPGLLAEVTHKIKTRYLQGITPAMRVLWKGRILDITYVDNSRQRQGELYLLAKELITS